jgi:hypothetical protein
MNEHRMLRPALIGGVLLGILSAIPIVSAFNCACCAWVIGGGVLAAYLLVKDSPIPVTLGRGALLGLLTGVIGTVTSTLINVPLQFLISRIGANPLEQMRQVFDKIPDMPPESRQMLETLLAQKNVGILFFIFSVFFTLIIYCLFAMLGGTIGVAIFEKRKHGTPPMDMPPQQPPANLPPPPPTDAP